MATPAQVEANRRNAELSTGPTSPGGKESSSQNPTRHGLAGTGVNVPGVGPEAFAGRYAAWAEVYRPEGEFATWVLRRVVAATFRIERCERSLEAVDVATARRAELMWDSDRRIEAAELFDRLGKSPARAVRRLEATPQGCDDLIEHWAYLEQTLRIRGGWDEAESWRVLDLLGVAPELRTGPLPIDPPPGVGATEHHLDLCRAALERLRSRRAALAPLDELEREQTASGAGGLVTKSARLLQRYERDAWRQLREGVEALRRLRPADAADSAPPLPFESSTRPAPASEAASHPAPAPVDEAPPPRGEAVTPRPNVARPAPAPPTPRPAPRAYSFVNIRATPELVATG